MQRKGHSTFGYLIIAFVAILLTIPVHGEPISGQAVIKMVQNGKPDDILPGSGAQVNDSIPGCQTYLLEIEDAAQWYAVIADLQADTQVIFVEPNYSVELPEIYQMSISFPDDYAPPLLEGVEPSSYFDQPSVYAIGIDEAQDIATGENIIVAVIDNGFDYSHPYLTSRLLTTGYDFIGGDGDPDYEEGVVADHGTFVSGIIALTAPDCRILPLKAFDGNGLGSTYAVAEAIHYAVEQGAEVINMSFGTVEPSRLLNQACNQAILNGVAMVAASGNNSIDNPIYPASQPGVIAVSGIDDQDYLAEFSNYGDYIDVCAPAVNIYSALTGESNWGTWSGTSFAAPFVSAACALVKQVSPDYSTFIMQEHIRATASIDLQWGTIVTPDPSYGYGRIDVFTAVDLADESISGNYGDLNGNGLVNTGDVVYLVQYVSAGGPPPVASANADFNCDGVIDEFDIEYFVNRIYHGGPRCGHCD